MEIKTIEKEFKSKVCNEVRLLQEGVDRFRIFTPFLFDDGDALAIVLRKTENEWFLTDEGHTFMHLSYEIDIDSLDKGTRARIISTTLNNFGIQERGGVIFASVTEENMGNVFYSYVQALIKITDVSYLTRERVRSTFWEDFRNFITQKVPAKGSHLTIMTACMTPREVPVDCRINKLDKPLYIFAINSDDKCNISTINLLQYEKWGCSLSHLPYLKIRRRLTEKRSRDSVMCARNSFQV
jgi:hypothetical protein